MAAKGSEGVAAAGGAAASASLPAAQEASLAGQYSALDINGGETGKGEKEEEEIPDFVARYASLHDREERLAEIAADLRLMEEERRKAGVPPTYIELAGFFLLHESAAAALEGLPTCLAPLF